METSNIPHLISCKQWSRDSIFLSWSLVQYSETQSTRWPISICCHAYSKIASVIWIAYPHTTVPTPCPSISEPDSPHNCTFQECKQSNFTVKSLSIICSSRTGKGLKVFWGKEENVGLITRWNPFTSAIPYTIFTSHVLVRKGRTDDPRLKIENVIPELERAVEDLRRAHASQQQEGEASASHAEFRVKQGDIIFNTYFGLSALVHNQSNLGFFKRRGAVDW